MTTTTLSAALARARESGLARFDAELLLAHCCGLDRSAIIARPEQALSTDQAHQYLTLVARRAEGEPVAYLLGRQGFMEIELEVSPAVLIPRPETELLVTTALERAPAGPVRVLELGTGSGAIALALAYARREWWVVATDVCPAALELARRNAARIAPGRVHLVCCDWFSGLGDTRFHLLVANPPYVAPGDPELAADVACHEPARALYADDGGMAALAELAAAAPDHLLPGGWILLEHGHLQAAAVRERLAASGLCDVLSLLDGAGIERVTIARRPR